MRLGWVEIRGFRRFEALTKIVLDGKVTALVGPNESGKTSVLTALRHLDNTTALTRHGPNAELTHDGPVIPDEQVIIRAGFRVEDAERAELAGRIPEASNVRWLEVAKPANGKLVFDVRPEVVRDRTPRQVLAGLLTEALQAVPQSAKTLDDVTRVERAISWLQDSSDTMGKDVIAEIQAAAQLVPIEISGEDPEAILGAWVTHERKAHPRDETLTYLQQRRPRFLLFGDEERVLSPTYDLNGRLSAALKNLANLAGLPLEQLKEASAQSNTGRVETLVQAANDRLRDLFNTSWSQAGVSVQFKTDGSALQVLVRNVHRQFTSIAERSEGLRYFVALLAFVASEEVPGRPSVLLVDEAESHLHYDAQADLIQMLARQTVSPQVVYSTHSVGCLPEDLGSWVRMVEPVKGGGANGAS